MTGACNMLLSFLPTGGGMGTAMTSDAPQGNTGMFHAVDVSGLQLTTPGLNGSATRPSSRIAALTRSRGHGPRERVNSTLRRGRALREAAASA